MDTRDPLFIIAALVIFVAAAYLVYNYGLSISGEHGEEHKELSEAEQIYFKFMEHDLGEGYSRTYYVNVDGLEKTLKLVKNEDMNYLELETLFNKEKLYYLENEILMCIESDGKEVCGEAEGEIKTYAESKERDFPSIELYEQEKIFSELLIESEAMTFSENVEEQELGGFTCDLIQYEIDYKKLTVAELEELGLADSPAVTTYSDYLITMCIDEEGELIYRNFSYFYQDSQVFSERLLLEKGEAEIIEIPGEFSQEELLQFYSVKLSIENKVYECLYDENPDSCFKEYGAYDKKTYYCEMAGKQKDSCFTIIAVDKLDVDLCTEVSDSSLKDDCYFEIGVRLKDSEICEIVVDETKQEECLGLITPEE